MRFPLSLQTIFLEPEPVALFLPDAAAVRLAYENGDIPFPYWSQVWPAAKALARFLATNPDAVAGKAVLELGAGLGLPSLVAARTAASVFCTDLVPEAVETVMASAEYLSLTNVCAKTLDWAQLPESLSADVLLLSDINYEPAAFNALQKLIVSFLQKGTTVLLSTPQRLMAKDFIQPLLGYCSRQEEVWVVHHEKQVATTVLMLEKKPRP